MGPQRQIGRSASRSSVELGESSDPGGPESEIQDGEGMGSPVTIKSQIEVQDMSENDSDARDSSPGGGRDPSGSPAGGEAARGMFHDWSRGPLGAVGIVNNRRVLVAQAREAEGLLRLVEADDGQASMAGNFTDWASMNADLAKLIQDKESLHEFVKRATDKVEQRDNEVQEWIAELSNMADIGSHKLVSARDRLPPDLGPALLRLVTLSLQDDDSIDKLPRRYKELLGEDVRLLAQKVLPPAPSQDVTVLRKELASARETAEAMENAVAERDGMVKDLESEKTRQAAVIDKLETKINNLISRYQDASERLGDRLKEKDQDLSRYRRRYRDLTETSERLNSMLVQAEEEKKRLSACADDAQKSSEEKDARIKQLDEDIKVFTAVEEGSRPALDVLKDSVNLLREQKRSAEEMHRKVVADNQERAQSQLDKQRRKVVQLQDDVTRLERENSRVWHLDRDKHDLEQQVADLAGRNKTLSSELEGENGRARQLEREKHDLEQQAADLTGRNLALEQQVRDLAGRNQTLGSELEAGARRDKAAGEEKKVLEEKNSRLDVTLEHVQASLGELKTNNEKLQASEKSLLNRIEQLKHTIKENDSARDNVVQNLRNDMGTWETKCQGLQAENEALRQDADAAERTIDAAKLQLSGYAQVRADLSRQKRAVESLERDKEDGRKRLDAAEEDRKRASARLDSSAKEVDTLRAEVQADKARISKLTEDKARDREKIRGQEERLQAADFQLASRETAVSSLDQQLKGKEAEVTRLLADVARLGTTEEEHKKSMVLEKTRNEKLQAQVSDAEKSLESERRRTAQLSKERDDLSASISAQHAEAAEAHGTLSRSLEDEKARAEQLDRSISEQRRQADDERRELQASIDKETEKLQQLQTSIDKERDKVQQLQGTVADLNGSIRSLQDKNVDAARESGALSASLERETAERTKLQQHVEETTSALERLQGEHQEQLKLAEAQTKDHDDARRKLVDEAERRGGELAHLTTQLSETESLVGQARSRAEDSLQELQSFLSRLCLAPPEDPAVFEGLARELQVPCTMVAREPARGTGWVILEAWGDQADEETTKLPEGLEMLILELYRTAGVRSVCTQHCHRVLQQTIETVSADTVIHAGTFGEMARVFVQAISAQPDDAFEVGLVLWQLFDVVQQRWGPANLNEVMEKLAGFLTAHEYRGVFEVVARRGQFEQCDDCHFFSDMSAVFARPDQPRAALINVNDQSIRFFSKELWTFHQSGCTVKPFANHPGVFLPYNSVHDVIWAGKVY